MMAAGRKMATAEAGRLTEGGRAGRCPALMHVVLGCGEQGLRADIVVINEPRLGARGLYSRVGARPL
jgi:hypothetical protein